MTDLVARAMRELPDTDKSRYDIAYERGRAQARSSLLFGGLAIGALAGAAATFLLDPERGKARRDELSQQLTERWHDVRHAAEDRAKDARNRAKDARTRAQELAADSRMTHPSTRDEAPAPRAWPSEEAVPAEGTVAASTENDREWTAAGTLGEPERVNA